MNSAVPAPSYRNWRQSSTAAPVIALRSSGSTAGEGVSYQFSIDKKSCLRMFLLFYLDNFLMSSLDRAITLVNVINIAVLVTKDLNFDVSNTLKVFFNQ